MRENSIDRLRASLRPLVWEHAGQVALGLLIAFSVGPFWWRHLDQPNLFAAGAVLHVYAVLMIALGVRVLVLLNTIDLASPVIQEQFARLRRSHATTRLAIGLPWSLLWIPLVMVVSGHDVLASMSPTWLIANVRGGVMAILVALWCYRANLTRSSNLRPRKE